MIDIHAHILPGLDDGAMDIYDTLEMAQMAAKSKVHTIIATPHCNAPGMYDNYFGEAYIEAFQKAVKAVRDEQIPVRICPGMEAFATYDLPELIVNKKIMPLNQSKYILVEFAFDEEPEYASDLLDRVKKVGAKPVVAHAERYKFMQSNPQIAYEWRKNGYQIQCNKASFSGKFGSRAKETAHSLMEHKLVSVIASDAHGSKYRTPNMLNEYRSLREKYSEKYLQLLFEENPRRICENRPVLRFDLIPFQE